MHARPGHVTNEKLVSLLIGDEWTKRTRNAAARLLAEDRNEEDGIVTQDLTINEHYNRYAKARASLYVIVAEAMGCATESYTESYEYQGRRLRYHVQVKGRSSDVARANDLYSQLASTILGRIVQIDGKDTLHQRRAAFQAFIAMISSRLHEIVSLPSLSWLPEHRTEAQHLGAA